MNCKLMISGYNSCVDVIAIDDQKLRISFRRTIRVPDNDETSLLPPDLGAFPLYLVDALEKKLPHSIAAKGGVLFPMHTNEAMWVRFKSNRQFAIKIYIGSINAVSGEPAAENMATKFRRQKLQSQGELLQDYVVTPTQLWLDGVATGPGVIRQFVATAVGSGYSVESQITGEDAVAGIQFEVTRRKPLENKVLIVQLPSSKRSQILVDLEFTSAQRLSSLIESISGIPVGKQRIQMTTSSRKNRLDLRSDFFSLEKLGIKEGDVLEVEERPGGLLVYIKTLTGKELTINWGNTETIEDLKCLIAEKEGTPIDQQRLIYAGQQLEENRTRSYYGIANQSTLHLVLRLRGGGPGFTVSTEVQAEMAIAAGGLIKQSIHRDAYAPDSWDPTSTIVFNVQILNAEIFQKVTGKAPPKRPADFKSYKKSEGKFFDIPEASSSLSGNFKGVKSVGQIKGQKDNDGSDDKSGPVKWSLLSYLNHDLTRGRPKREFRTTKDIEDEITRSNIVSW